MRVTADAETKKILKLQLSELMSKSDRQQLSESIERAAAASGRIRMLIELQEPRANDPGALLEDLSFIKVYADRMERIAIVGTQTWENTWVAIARLFARVEVRYFDHQHLREARQWLNSYNHS